MVLEITLNCSGPGLVSGQVSTSVVKLAALTHPSKEESKFTRVQETPATVTDGAVTEPSELDGCDSYSYAPRWEWRGLLQNNTDAIDVIKKALFINDQVIYLKTQRGSCYEGKLRRISFRDPETNKKLTFLTNRFDLATQTICDLYKARWKVELFFKTMQQYLRVKKFLGTSANAVKAQILVALIAYLLVQILRFTIKASISIADAMAVVGTLLLLKEPLTRILGDLPRVTRRRHDFQMVFNL